MGHLLNCPYKSHPPSWLSFPARGYEFYTFLFLSVQFQDGEKTINPNVPNRKLWSAELIYMAKEAFPLSNKLHLKK